MSCYAITGSSGRVGRALHFGLALSETPAGIDLTPSSATSQLANIMDYDALRRAFEGKNVVFHTASLHAPHVDVASDDAFQRINVDGTVNVTRAAMECGVSMLVFTSTTALYGQASQRPDRASWIDENTEPLPRTIYHRTKIAAEQALKEFASQSFRVRVVRMSRCFPEPASTMAVYRLHRGIDVRDVANAHFAAASDPTETPFDQYVVSGKTPFRREDCEDLKLNPGRVITHRMPKLVELFEQRGWELPSSIDRVYDSSHAKARLGWVPEFGPEEVLAQFDRRCFEVLPPVWTEGLDVS